MSHSCVVWGFLRNCIAQELLVSMGVFAVQLFIDAVSDTQAKCILSIISLFVEKMIVMDKNEK